MRCSAKSMPTTTKDSDATPLILITRYLVATGSPWFATTVQAVENESLVIRRVLPSLRNSTQHHTKGTKLKGKMCSAREMRPGHKGLAPDFKRATIGENY